MRWPQPRAHGAPLQPGVGQEPAQAIFPGMRPPGRGQHPIQGGQRQPARPAAGAHEQGDQGRADEHERLAHAAP